MVFFFFPVQVGSKTVETCYLLMMAVPSPSVVGEGGSWKLPDFAVLVCLCFISGLCLHSGTSWGWRVVGSQTVVWGSKGKGDPAQWHFWDTCHVPGSIPGKGNPERSMVSFPKELQVKWGKWTRKQTQRGEIHTDIEGSAGYSESTTKVTHPAQGCQGGFLGEALLALNL